MKTDTVMHGLTTLTADSENQQYEGTYCSGTGDPEFLRLIDESFAFFHSNPVVPNLAMLYNEDWDSFAEGAGWGSWWIQNSYGFSYAATPFITEPWISLLQRSWDLHWDNQGDGIRKGRYGEERTPPLKLAELVGPDGCLGDCAYPGAIAYKQGDGDLAIKDWFYEATAAGVVMQAEILLANRDEKALSHYLPKMERACNCIEKTRDPMNNLFLVGPGCNLLSPSYGGVKLPDGTFGKGYLAGLSITYLAALDRMVELYKLTGDSKNIKEFECRQKITRDSLCLLMTDSGYFVKALEPDGTQHGVLGQKQFGYLEGVANADAVALRVVDSITAESIYNQIAACQAIRPFDFLLTNAPGLDDTCYGGWGRTSGKGLQGIWRFGDWINGGVWGTVEGRAILMYYRLGKFEDIRRSAVRAMKWAKDFRMDAPWSQQGENTHNVWSDSGKNQVGGVAVMVDNFAIPAATVRGLFDYDYRSDRLILRPRIPGTITQYSQKQPVRFGEKALYLSCINGGANVQSVAVNGKSCSVGAANEVVLWYKDLPAVSQIDITTEGGWPLEQSTVEYPLIPGLVEVENEHEIDAEKLPQSLQEPYRVLLSMQSKLEENTSSVHDVAFINETIKSIVDCAMRPMVDCGNGYFRPITPERTKGINEFYEKTTVSMYKGFVKRMEKYSENGNREQKRMAATFHECL